MTPPTRILGRSTRCALGLLAVSLAPPLVPMARAQSGNPTFTPSIGGNVTDTAQPLPSGTRGSGYWLPGAPLPVGGQNSANNPTNSTGGLKADQAPIPGRGTGEYVVRPEDLGTTAIVVDDPRAGDPANVPDTHLVRKGDTLWDIASAYYRNPYVWPKLWSYNPVVTNPHWIYPGDTLRLRPAGGFDAIPTAPSPIGGPPSPPLRRIYRDGGSEGGIRLRATGFVEPDELKAAGTIAASREERMMLATLDETYIDYGDQAKPHPGDRLTIYKIQRDLKKPGTRTVVGSVVEVMGELEIRTVVDKKMARAVIVDARQPIERGFRVGPLRRRFEPVAPVADTASVDAQVLGALTPVELMGEAALIFIDHGKSDGLEVGNRLMVVRRGDGYMRRMGTRPSNDRAFPREVMGEVQIVDVRDKTATAIVMRSIKEVEVGDLLEARKGY